MHLELLKLLWSKWTRLFTDVKYMFTSSLDVDLTI